MNTYTVSFEFATYQDGDTLDPVRNFLDSHSVPSYFDLFSVDYDEDGACCWFSSFEANLTFAQATDLLNRLRTAEIGIKTVGVYELQNVDGFVLGTPIKKYEFA